MTATVVQNQGTNQMKSYGPYAIIPGDDFAECGLDQPQLKALTLLAYAQGATPGYCDVIYKDDNGKKIGQEIAVV